MFFLIGSSTGLASYKLRATIFVKFLISTVNRSKLQKKKKRSARTLLWCMMETEDKVCWAQ